MGEAGRLKDKVAVVTGAASGIGEAIAVLCAREGGLVALVDVQEEKGRQVEQRISGSGGKAIFLAADMGEEETPTRIINTVLSRFGGLDVLVNNAALHGPYNKKSVVDTSLEVWDRTLNVNLRAIFLLCKFGVPHMVARGGGSIVNIASIGGVEAFPEFAAYSTSKGGLIQLTKCLAIDFGRHKVRANAICPGAIDTPGAQPFMEDRQQYLDMIASLTPLQDIGAPEDIAYAALYLACEESRYVTGTTLVVDGGRIAVA